METTPTPSENAPAKPAPVKAAPAAPAPTGPAPATPVPAKPVPAKPAPVRARRSWRRKLAFGLTALLFLFLAMELLVRVFWDRPPRFLGERLQKSGLFQPDPHLGWRARPNQEFVHELYGNRSSTIRTNAQGFRDRDRDPQQRAHKHRILVLGDSFAFGWGVENDETFPHLLDQQLKDTEVINLGLTGFHLAQEHQLLLRHGLAYKPDLVVLALCQNDICDQRIVPADEVRRRRQEGGAGFRAFLLRHCYLLDFLRLQLATIRPLRRLLQSLGLKEGDAGYEALDTNLRPALKSYPPQLQTEWDRSMRELAAIHETCRKADIPLLVAAIPTKESVSPDALSLKLSYSKFTARDFDMQKPHTALARFCKQQGIGFLDGMPAISKLGAQAYSQHDMHFSPAGHRAFATAIRDALPPLGDR